MKAKLTLVFEMDIDPEKKGMYQEATDDYDEQFLYEHFINEGPSERKIEFDAKECTNIYMC